MYNYVGRKATPNRLHFIKFVLSCYIASSNAQHHVVISDVKPQFDGQASKGIEINGQKLSTPLDSGSRARQEILFHLI